MPGIRVSIYKLLQIAKEDSQQTLSAAGAFIRFSRRSSAREEISFKSTTLKGQVIQLPPLR